ncbi:MAG: short-chain dehydrogenase [Gemmatimonadetes bacterium]|nr:MAG: short-chain dehydrogenase [Gemmatimonadota bacterium]
MTKEAALRRVALVTGAGRRIGQAIALGLAGEGYDVAVHYHGSAAGAKETLAAVERLGRTGTLLAADLRDAGAARALADRTVQALGGLHALVNSAAVMVRQPVEEVTPESWDATLELNLRAGFFVAQGAIPHLRRSRGSIVNIADVAAFEPWPAYVPHCVSKAGVVMLTKGLARALAPDIAVNAVAPGPVLLPDEWDEVTRRHFAATTPLQRLGTPEDVVAAVRFLLASDYTTGTVLIVDGGRVIR